LKRLNTILIALTILLACSPIDQKKKSATTNLAYDKAFTFLEAQKIDSAFHYFNKAKEVFLLHQDSLGVGKCLLNMAIISTDRSDNFGGQELSLSAQDYLNKNIKAQWVYVSSNYNTLGINTYRLGDHKNALRFYDEALRFAESNESKRIIMNNKATLYRETKNYDKAIQVLKQVLAGVSKSPSEYARALCNLAITKWESSPAYPAQIEMQQALAIRKHEKDSIGINASYAHFSDFYEKSSPMLALGYAKKMYAVSQYNKRADDQLQALQKIIKLSPGEESKKYFAIYQNKQDSLDQINNSAKNQFALIRYESEKNKTEKLVAQKDNQAKKYQILLLASGLLLTIVSAVLIYRKRKQKIDLQAKNAIRDNQLRTSKKVHDVVANGLYQVMTEIENKPGIDREAVLDKIEDLYEKSRDISYEKPLSADQPYQQIVSELLTSFASDGTKVLIAGNAEDVWDKVTDPVRYEILQILQELMINMKKHSGAGNVVLRFERMGSIIKIFYTDNGKGMAEIGKFNNGLRNTGNRIESISGAITFDSVPGRGLKIEVFFPVA
jgi:hypothetical protein